MLVQTLGGGWDRSALPERPDLRQTGYQFTVDADTVL